MFDGNGRILVHQTDKIVHAHAIWARQLVHPAPSLVNGHENGGRDVIDKDRRNDLLTAPQNFYCLAVDRLQRLCCGSGGVRTSDEVWAAKYDSRYPCRSKEGFSLPLGSQIFIR